MCRWEYNKELAALAAAIDRAPVYQLYKEWPENPKNKIGNRRNTGYRYRLTGDLHEKQSHSQTVLQ